MKNDKEQVEPGGHDWVYFTMDVELENQSELFLSAGNGSSRILEWEAMIRTVHAKSGGGL